MRVICLVVQLTNSLQIGHRVCRFSHPFSMGSSISAYQVITWLGLTVIHTKRSWGIFTKQTDKYRETHYLFYIFVCLLFYVKPSTSVLVILLRVIGRAEETSTYSCLRFCTINSLPVASNYYLSDYRILNCDLQ